MVFNTTIHLCLCWNILSLVCPCNLTVEICITNINAYIAILLSVPHADGHFELSWAAGIYDGYDARQAYTYFSEQECDLVTVLVCINLTLPLRKSCSAHMTAFLKLLCIAMLTNGHNH